MLRLTPAADLNLNLNLEEFFLKSSNASSCLDAAVDTCSRLELELELGRVFLKSSNASSSFRTLIVSAKAASSSARVFERASHSEVLVAQLFDKSAKKALSSARVACVSSRSFCILTIATPSSPICFVFASMVLVRA